MHSLTATAAGARALTPFMPPHGDVEPLSAGVITIITIASLLGAQSALALIEHLASEHHHLMEMLRSGYRELGIMGLITFALFIASASGAIAEGSDAVAEVESVHVWIFSLAVLFLLIVLSLSMLSVSIANEWEAIEDRYALSFPEYNRLKHSFLELQRLVGLTAGTGERLVALPATPSTPVSRRRIGCCTAMRHPISAHRYWEALRTLRFLEQRWKFVAGNSLPTDFSFHSYLRKAKQHVFKQLVEVPLGAWFVLLTAVVADLFFAALLPDLYKSIGVNPGAQVLAVAIPAGAVSLLVLYKVHAVHTEVMHGSYLEVAARRVEQLQATQPRATAVGDEEAPVPPAALNPHVVQQACIEAQRELFWLGRPSLLLHLMQGSLWGSALGVSLVVRYWYVFFLSPDSLGSHGAEAVSSQLWIAVLALLIAVGAVWLMKSVVPLYITALHTGELVDMRLLMEAVEKQRQLERAAKVRARRRAATRALDAQFGPPPRRERLAVFLYRPGLLVPLLAGALAVFFLSSILLSDGISPAVRYRLHVLQLVVIALLTVEQAARLWVEGGVAACFCLLATPAAVVTKLSHHCCCRRVPIPPAPAPAAFGLGTAELWRRSLWHLLDASTTAIALVSSATAFSITQRMLEAGAVGFADAAPLPFPVHVYGIPALIACRLLRHAVYWQPWRPPPAAFRGGLARDLQSSRTASAQALKSHGLRVIAVSDDGASGGLAVTASGDLAAEARLASGGEGSSIGSPPTHSSSSSAAFFASGNAAVSADYGVAALPRAAGTRAASDRLPEATQLDAGPLAPAALAGGEVDPLRTLTAADRRHMRLASAAIGLDVLGLDIGATGRDRGHSSARGLAGILASKTFVSPTGTSLLQPTAAVRPDPGKRTSVDGRVASTGGDAILAAAALPAPSEQPAVPALPSTAVSVATPGLATIREDAALDAPSPPVSSGSPAVPAPAPAAPHPTLRDEGGLHLHLNHAAMDAAAVRRLVFALPAPVLQVLQEVVAERLEGRQAAATRAGSAPACAVQGPASSEAPGGLPAASPVEHQLGTSAASRALAQQQAAAGSASTTARRINVSPAPSSGPLSPARSGALARHGSARPKSGTPVEGEEEDDAKWSAFFARADKVLKRAGSRHALTTPRPLQYHRPPWDVGAGSTLAGVSPEVASPSGSPLSPATAAVPAPVERKPPSRFFGGAVSPDVDGPAAKGAPLASPRWLPRVPSLLPRFGRGGAGFVAGRPTDLASGGAETARPTFASAGARERAGAGPETTDSAAPSPGLDRADSAPGHRRGPTAAVTLGAASSHELAAISAVLRAQEAPTGRTGDGGARAGATDAINASSLMLAQPSERGRPADSGEVPAAGYFTVAAMGGRIGPTEAGVLGGPPAAGVPPSSSATGRMRPLRDIFTKPSPAP